MTTHPKRTDGYCGDSVSIVPLPTVYFIQANGPSGPVKIGYTGRRVSQRLAEGQTFAPEELTVLVEAPGTPADEAKLHRLFSQHRIRGEWFTYGPEIQELVWFLIEGGSLTLWLEAF